MVFGAKTKDSVPGLHEDYGNLVTITKNAKTYRILPYLVHLYRV